MKQHRHPSRITVALKGAALAISACAVSSASKPANTHAVEAPADLRAYVERVFRFQHRVMDEVIARSEAHDPLRSGLASAEQRLTESCRYLNASAAAFAGGEEPPLALKLTGAATRPHTQYGQPWASTRGGPRWLTYRNPANAIETQRCR